MNKKAITAFKKLNNLNTWNELTTYLNALGIPCKKETVRYWARTGKMPWQHLELVCNKAYFSLCYFYKVEGAWDPTDDYYRLLNESTWHRVYFDLEALWKDVSRFHLQKVWKVPNTPLRRGKYVRMNLARLIQIVNSDARFDIQRYIFDSNTINSIQISRDMGHLLKTLFGAQTETRELRQLLENKDKIIKQLQEEKQEMEERIRKLVKSNLKLNQKQK